MKKIFTILSYLVLFSIARAYAQEEWNTIPFQLYVMSSDGIISNRSNNSFQLYNSSAESKELQKQNRFSWKKGTLSLKIIRTDANRRFSFDIEDIHNDPTQYKYKVYTTNGKLEYTQDINWGFTVYLNGDDGKEYWIRYFFGNKPNYKAYQIAGYTNKRGTFSDEWTQCYDFPSQVAFTLQEDNSCAISLFSSVPNINVAHIKGLNRIEFNLGSGANIRVYNFSSETETLYGKVKAYITTGDNLMLSENYYQAASEYSRAIDKGYKNYDIYFRRACAYFANQFYNNAIDDCTKAISYKSTTDAYLLRGKAKLLKEDMSGIDDLKKGGSEGLALVREMELDKIPSKPQYPSQNDGKRYLASGSGFFISADGLIATNYHVIDGANGIDVLINSNSGVKTYKAQVLVSDRTNDISIIKIDDGSFVKLQPLPYAVKTSILDVGTSVFALGYPMSNLLGEEIKVTDGIISSKTGFQGDIVTYQISAPIQPGNSGGPLFDKQGNLVGITNAGVPDAQNVGYAIKSSYLRNLADAAPIAITLPATNSISELSFTEKIKRLTPYVVLIKIY